MQTLCTTAVEHPSFLRNAALNDTIPVLLFMYLSQQFLQVMNCNARRAISGALAGLTTMFS